MIITNKLNLPISFVNMAKSEYTYTEKRYSATSLLKPIRELLLGRRHNETIEQDVGDMVWLLLGQAVHKILEDGAKGEQVFTEEKLEHKLDNGYTVSGIIDLYDMDNAEVVDYKTASVWKVMFGDYTDWELQGLTYAWLLHKNGLPCDKITFWAILKDFNSTEAKFKPDYPKHPVHKVTFDVTDSKMQYIDKFINEKMNDIIMCESLEDSQLPLCSEADRWNKGNKYAVMKNGRKTALRVLDSLAEAEQYKANNGGEYIETRKGEDRKCIDYCSCAVKCKYWQENYKEENL